MLTTAGGRLFDEASADVAATLSVRSILRLLSNTAGRIEQQSIDVSETEADVEIICSCFALWQCDITGASGGAPLAISQHNKNTNPLSQMAINAASGRRAYSLIVYANRFIPAKIIAPLSQACNRRIVLLNNEQLCYCSRYSFVFTTKYLLFPLLI